MERSIFVWDEAKESMTKRARVRERKPKAESVFGSITVWFWWTRPNEQMNQRSANVLNEVFFSFNQFRARIDSILWSHNLNIIAIKKKKRRSANGECGDAISSHLMNLTNHKLTLNPSNFPYVLFNESKFNILFLASHLLFSLARVLMCGLTKHVLCSLSLSLSLYAVKLRNLWTIHRRNTVQPHSFCISIFVFYSVSVYTIPYFVQWQFYFSSGFLPLLVFCKHEPSWKTKLERATASERRERWSEKKVLNPKAIIMEMHKIPSKSALGMGDRVCCSLIMFVHLIRFWFCKCRNCMQNDGFLDLRVTCVHIHIHGSVLTCTFLFAVHRWLSASASPGCTCTHRYTRHSATFCSSLWLCRMCLTTGACWIYTKSRMTE